MANTRQQNRNGQQNGQYQGNGNGGNGQRGNPPVQSWKVGAPGGGFIEVAVWAKEVGQGDNQFTAYSTSVNRSYNDNGEWKNTTSLRHEHIPIAVLLMQKAYEWVIMEKAGEHHGD